jgi:hypothetical protein
LFSWYDVALRLRLPELIEQNCRDDCVLTNLVSALIKESSVRNRRTPEVTVSGLAVMPKATTLPMLVTAERVPSPQEPSPLRSLPPKNAVDLEQTSSKQRDLKPLIMKRLVESHDRHLFKTAKTSIENWLPDDLRKKSLQRDLTNAKETLGDSIKWETSMAREMKRLLVSDLDRAKMEEALDAKHKQPCGCCTLEFLDVNLPLKVSRKAILDIRVKWSGELNSVTIFRNTNIHKLLAEQAELPAATFATSAAGNNNSGTRKQKQHHASYDAVPACYDQVGVCVFCAQFFQEPEEYRPSYQMITFQERKTAFYEIKRKEKEYWDPLKIIEDDRMRLEALDGEAGKILD